MIDKNQSKCLYKYALVIKREFKMAGYWPSSVFCIVMDLDFVSLHNNGKRRAGKKKCRTKLELAGMGPSYPHK